jgi:predicted NBD/HSP70 family sugar kinase
MMPGDILALDIGGSSVKVGLFSPDVFTANRTLKRRMPEVPIAGKQFADVRKAVFHAVRVSLETVEVERIGISTTGSVDADGIVKSAGHFAGYERIDWMSLLKPEFPALKDVRVSNDGKASAWAEYRYLSGEGYASHVHFVLGTGVGSSIVVNGRLIDGDSGEAGFLGHTRVTDEETIVCSCDLQGCLETIASAPGLVYEYNKVASNKVTSFALYQERLRQGDEAAIGVLRAACLHFGRIAAVLVNGLNPRNITFGGGVILGIRAAFASLGDEQWFLKQVREKVSHDAFYRSADSTDLRFGSLDNDGGLIGAALLSLEK